MANPLPSATPAPPTGDLVADAMTTGYRWLLDSSRTLDWTISDGFAGEFWISPAGVRDSVAEALAMFSYYANISFSYAGYWSTPSVAATAGSEINVSLSGSFMVFPSVDIWARAFFPNANLNLTDYVGAPGDVFLNINSAANSLPSYEPGSAGWFLLLHELGHALGLKHPHDDGGTGRPTLTQIGMGGFDTDWATVMSYDDDLPFTLTAFDPATPMLLDVLALQALYGPNMNTNAGDGGYELLADGMYRTIWDAAGDDYVTAENSSRGWEIYLPGYQLSTTVSTLAGWARPLDEVNLSTPLTLYWLTGTIEDAVGSAQADEIYGSEGDNVLVGGGGDDYLQGWFGDDTLAGGAGNDELDGESGADLAHYDLSAANYSWWSNPDGTWWVQALAGAEGRDLLDSVETLSFADRAIKLSGQTVAEAIGYSVEHILRIHTDPTGQAELIADQVAAGQMSLTAGIEQLVRLADATTSVATLSYQFFTGRIPGQPGIEYLVSPTGPNANNINSAYYQSFSLENRYINFAVNLGKLGEGNAQFTAEYGSLTLFEATKKAYAEIFGATPTDAKVSALLEPSFVLNGVTMTRAEYFELYGRDGENGIGTKAAMVGWLLAEAEKADLGIYARSNAAFLTDLADGAQFGVDLVGVYGRPEYVYGGA